MKATLKFELPDEYQRFKDAMYSSEIRFAFDELIAMLRSKTKHGHNYESTEQALDEIYQYALTLRSDAESYD